MTSYSTDSDTWRFKATANKDWKVTTKRGGSVDRMLHHRSHCSAVSYLGLYSLGFSVQCDVMDDQSFKDLFCLVPVSWAIFRDYPVLNESRVTCGHTWPTSGARNNIAMAWRAQHRIINSAFQLCFAAKISPCYHDETAIVPQLPDLKEASAATARHTPLNLWV